MKPRLVEGPLPFQPRRCWVTHQSEGRFFDLGEPTVLEPRAYLHVSAVESLAGDLGWIGPDEAQSLRDERDQYEQDAINAIGERDEYARELDAINYIKARGYKPTKKTGPRPKTQKAAA